MSDIFVDGVRSVAVANGVARIELVQLQRDAGQTKLEPQVVARLMIPVAALKEFAAHLATSVQRIEANARTHGEGNAGQTADVDHALENL
ncbi:MAG: hypothetical protein ACE5GS_08615 [Kiloniellaceae bacterium]